MNKGRGQSVPARLRRLEQRFATWRKTRSIGQRIPKALWHAAARLALDFGIHRTAKFLKLDYYSLKKHVDSLPGSSNGGKSQRADAQSTFIELPAPPNALVECVIELDDRRGAFMRMHLKGAEYPDVVALGRSFWSAE